jgi:hypothetical protein
MYLISDLKNLKTVGVFVKLHNFLIALFDCFF